MKRRNHIMQAIQTMDLVKRYKDLTAVDRLN